MKQFRIHNSLALLITTADLCRSRSCRMDAARSSAAFATSWLALRRDPFLGGPGVFLCAHDAGTSRRSPGIIFPAILIFKECAFSWNL